MSKCLLNHEAFDIITDDAAYWIGFLFADGSVVRERKGAPMVQVRLSEVDRGQLVKLRIPRFYTRYWHFPTREFRWIRITGICSACGKLRTPGKPTSRAGSLPWPYRKRAGYLTPLLARRRRWRRLDLYYKDRLYGVRSGGFEAADGRIPWVPERTQPCSSDDR
jgi:hypothetical protein